MKKSVWMWVLAIAVLLPATSFGQERQSYVTINPGVYFFTGDIEDEHPMGFHGDFVFGHSIYPDLFLEGGIGYFHDGVSDGNDVRGYLLHIGAKKMFPVNRWNLFLGAGIGMGRTEYLGTLKGVYIDEEDDIVFGHFSLGADYNINSRLFLGFEGKYLMTSEADYGQGVSVDVNGFAPMVRFGFRF